MILTTLLILPKYFLNFICVTMINFSDLMLTIFVIYLYNVIYL